jgi:monoamine oxidase
MQSVGGSCDGKISPNALNSPLNAAISAFGINSSDQAVMDVILDQEFAGDYGAETTLLNRCAGAFGKEFEGQDLLIFNGFNRITDALSAGLNVRLGEAVETVRWTESSVSISTSKRRYDAAYCICTVPLGVLKSGGIDFKNDLPEMHLDAISGIGFGNFVKAYVTFQNEAVLPKTTIAFAGDERRVFRNLVGISGIARRPAVMAYAGGEDANKASQMSDRAIAQEIADSVALARRGASSRIADVTVSRWSEDPFALGAYSYPGVATKREHFEALATPVDGRLYFAGEAASQYFGTVHGAHISGNEAAGKILAA